MDNVGHWSAMSRRRGIGLRRHRRKLRSHGSYDLSPEVLPADSHHVATPSDHAEGVCTPDVPSLTQPHPEHRKSPGKQHPTECADDLAPLSQPAPMSVYDDDDAIIASEHAQALSSTGPTNDAVPPKLKSPVNKSKKASRKGPWTKKTKKCKKPKNRTKLRCKSNCLAPTASSMIRCSVCMAWYHTVCCGEDAEYTGVWSCDTCRSIPNEISKLSAQVILLVSQIEAFQGRDSALISEIQQLKSENGTLKSKLANAEKQNNDLTKLIETMSFSNDIKNDTPAHGVWPDIPTSNRFDALRDASVSDEVGSATVGRPPQRSSMSQHCSQTRGSSPQQRSKPQRRLPPPPSRLYRPRPLRPRHRHTDGRQCAWWEAQLCVAWLPWSTTGEIFMLMVSFTPVVQQER